MAQCVFQPNLLLKASVDTLNLIFIASKSPSSPSQHNTLLVGCGGSRSFYSVSLKVQWPFLHACFSLIVQIDGNPSLLQRTWMPGLRKMTYHVLRSFQWVFMIQLRFSSMTNLSTEWLPGITGPWKTTNVRTITHNGDLNICWQKKPRTCLFSICTQQIVWVGPRKVQRSSFEKENTHLAAQQT